MKYILLILISIFTVQTYAAETVVYQSSGEFDPSIYPATASYVFDKNGGPVSVSVVGRREVCYPDTTPNRRMNCVYQVEPISVHQIPNLKFVPDVGNKGAIVYEAPGVDTVICNYKKSFGRLKATGLCKLDLKNVYDKKKQTETYELTYFVNLAE